MKRILILGSMMFFFVFLAFSISFHWTDFIDEMVYGFISSFQSSFFTFFMKCITFLGEPITIFFFCLTTLIGLYIREKQLMPFFLLMIISAFAILLIKMLIARERPDFFQMISIDGYSFPSGHTLISVVYYGYLIHLIKHHIPGKVKYGLVFLLLLFIFFIGISRIYLGVHYVTDVLAGCFLGIFLIECTIWLEEKCV